VPSVRILPKNVAGLWIYVVISNVSERYRTYGCLIAEMGNGLYSLTEGN